MSKLIIPDFSPPAPPRHESAVLERIAAVLSPLIYASQGGGGTAMPWAASPERDRALGVARDIIAAMREPSKEMLSAAHAGVSREQVRQVEIHVTDAATVWQAMIDEILR